MVGKVLYSDKYQIWCGWGVGPQDVVFGADGDVKQRWGFIGRFAGKGKVFAWLVG